MQCLNQGLRTTRNNCGRPRRDWKSCVLQGTVGSNPTLSAANALARVGSASCGGPQPPRLHASQMRRQGREGTARLGTRAEP
jgi:hypothetical protein